MKNMNHCGFIALVVLMTAILVSGCHRRCVKSCKGLPNGKYQSCKGCNYFSVCCHGYLFTAPCRHGYHWDDFFKRCQKISSTCPKPATEPCITNCTGIPDGVYQSCKDCHLYAVCNHGNLHVKTCYPGTYWDDSRKRCQKTSYTCPNTTVPNRCISSCEGVPDGDYQSCLDCHVFASCSNGIIYNNRSCPAHLVWDDFRKRCEYESPTCPAGESNPCLSNCTGQPDGNYQSCKSCDVYATCCHGHLIDDIKCPSGTMWDDSLKRCEKTSKTCQESTTTPETGLLETAEYPCITNCSGKPDGAYQSCVGCGVYITCSNTVLTIMPCSGNTVWDDSLKRCQEKSVTCPKFKYLVSNP